MAFVTVKNKIEGQTTSIEESNFLRSSFKTGKRISLINEVLPFRIRFTSIQVPGISSSNVPPIPLQIIGYSNYIL
jgi:hypothetical protein